MARIAVAGEGDPGVPHLRREGDRIGTAAGHLVAELRVAEHERDLESVGRAEASVPGGAEPVEAVHVRRRTTAFDLRFGEFDRAEPGSVRGEDEVEVGCTEIGVGGAIRVEDLFGVFPVDTSRAFDESGVVELEELPVVGHEQSDFVEVGADHHGYGSGHLRADRVEGVVRNVGADHGPEARAAFARGPCGRGAAGREQALGRHLAQLVRVALADAQFVEQAPGGDRRALGGRHPECRPRLDHRAVEQPGGPGHREQGRNLRAATRLAEDQHVAGIAAEPLDVVAHPLE